MPNTGYAKGGDMLLFVDGKAVGHCTSHDVDHNTETKDRAVKAPASAGSSGLWKEKTVTGLSVSVKFSGLVFYGEEETSVKDVKKKWVKGQPVEVRAQERGVTSGCQMYGNFVIDSLSEKAAEGEDMTYDGSLSNTGEVKFYEEAQAAVAAANPS